MKSNHKKLPWPFQVVHHLYPIQVLEQLSVVVVTIFLLHEQHQDYH